MQYISTRGQAPSLGFDEVVLAGLASDGGLYVPQEYPQVDAATLRAWSELPYPQLAAAVLHRFVGDTLSLRTLEDLAEAAYSEFRHAAIAPLVQLGQNHWVLELFHGPTLAFKDFALQFLGRLLDHLLAARDERVTIVGATSGDTGSAAIAACRGRERMRSFILYPHGRISEVQRRQMTTVGDANVHAIAIDGTFDDCQRIVKDMFVHREFCEAQKLAAVNSINWARVLTQAVYYFYASFALGVTENRRIAFSVPTGNFGDVYAGYIAKRMGLPVGPLLIATNRNDILARVLRDGSYAAGSVTPTHSPSMDIQVASNFERLLFDATGRDAGAMHQRMQAFAAQQHMTVEGAALEAIRADFVACSVDDATTEATIRRLHQTTGYVLDPHTAVGVAAAEETLLRQSNSMPVVTLATAHPAKFPDVVAQATGAKPALPLHMADLFTRTERIIRLPNSTHAIEEYIADATS